MNSFTHWQTRLIRRPELESGAANQSATACYSRREIPKRINILLAPGNITTGWSFRGVTQSVCIETYSAKFVTLEQLKNFLFSQKFLFWFLIWPNNQIFFLLTTNVFLFKRRNKPLSLLFCQVVFVKCCHFDWVMWYWVYFSVCGVTWVEWIDSSVNNSDKKKKVNGPASQP